VYEKPLPVLEGLSGEFYGWLRKHELRFQRCLDCDRWRHVPRALCPSCQSSSWEWARSSGRGRVFAWCTVRRGLHPAFADDVPFTPVVVEVDEGPRMVTWVVDIPPDELEAGLPVRVVFDDVTPDTTLAKFEKAANEKPKIPTQN